MRRVVVTGMGGDHSHRSERRGILERCERGQNWLWRGDSF